MLIFLCCYSTNLLGQRTFERDSIEEPIDSLVNTLEDDSLQFKKDDDGFLEKDTLDIPNRISKVAYTVDLEFGNWQMPDTNITNQQYYLPPEQPLNHYKWLGNIGLHHYPVFFQPNSQLNFDWGLNNLNQYPQERRFYKAGYPLTVAQYVWGLHGEQFFRTMHTQNVNPYVNILVDYQVVGAEGIYANQKTNAQNLIFGTSFKTKSGRYQNHLTYRWNRYKLSQNGGVNDTALDSTSTFNKPLLNVNLINGRHDNRDRTINMWHAWDIGFFKYRKDSIKIKVLVPQVVSTDSVNTATEIETPLLDLLESDSLETEVKDKAGTTNAINVQNDSINDLINEEASTIGKTDTIMVEVEQDSVFTVKDFYPTFRFFHDLTFLSDEHHYGDFNFPTDFYPINHYSNIATDDSLTRNQWTNEFGVLFLGKNFVKSDTSDTHFRAKLSFVHEYIRFKTLNTGNGQFINSRDRDNAYGQLKLFNYGQKITYSLELAKGILGWNASAWKAHLKADYKTKFGTLGGEYLTNRKRPEEIYTRIYTNHHQWTNQNLQSVVTNKIGANLTILDGKVELSAAQYLIDNYTYFNQNQEVSQLADQLSIQQLSATGKGKVNNWHGQVNMVLQNANTDYLPIPNFMLTGSVWYETKIFKAMWIEIGGMFEYNSNYYTPLFAPSIEQFYWQDQAKTSFYPQADVFINARVRTVRFIVRTQNMTQNIFQSSNLTYVEGYPMLDRGVKLGLTWWFFD